GTVTETLGEGDDAIVMIRKRGCGLGREVEEERPRADACRGRDLLDRRLVEAALQEEPQRVLGEHAACLQSLLLASVHVGSSSPRFGRHGSLRRTPLTP